MSIQKMTVRGRLAVGFGLVLLLLAAVASTSLIQLAGFNRNVQEVASVRMTQLITTGQITGVLNQITRATANVLVLDDEKHIKEELASIRSSRDAIKDLLSKVAGTLRPGRETDLYKQITTSLDAYFPDEERFLKEAEAGNYSGAKDVMRCLERLAPDPRRAIWLAMREGLTHEEVSARMGRPLGTVKSWIRRGLIELKGCLES